MISDILNFPKVIGKNLKKLRIIKELTITELSKKSGVSVSVISQMENAKVGLKFINLRRVLLVMDFSVGLFFSKIQDEIQEFSFDPVNLIQKRENQILLFGNREKSNILLMRPLEGLDSEQILEIKLEPEQYLFPTEIILDCHIKIIVASGSLLLEQESDEFWIKTGEHFQSRDFGAHKYRNIGKDTVVFYMILDKALI